MARTKSDLTSWPDDLALTPLLRQFAEERKLDAEHEWENFHDSALANGRKYADWRAAWRTWCRNVAKWKAEKTPLPYSHYFAPIDRAAISPTLVQQHEQWKREDEATTPEQRAANLKKLHEMTAKIGLKI